jgi:23S rRNA (uracil1939-C5)-methyltransferase
MVELQLPKLLTWVRFPSPAPSLVHDCPHRPPCPGCPRFGEPGVAQGALRILDELAARHGLPRVAVESGATRGFRCRARLAIRGRVNTPKLGLFELGTHRVVHIPHCSVHHPLINRVADVVRRSLVEAGVTNYSDTAHAGIARYLQVVVERSSQRAQVVLVANAIDAEPLRACLELIRVELGQELHSLWFNSQCSRTNTILGEQFQHIAGASTVVERFGGAAVHYPPGAFGQNNLEIAARIVAHVRDQVSAGARVTEFYAGVGAIGLSLVDRVGDIRLNEVSSHSLQGLALGIDGLAPAERAKVSVVPGPAERDET